MLAEAVGQEDLEVDLFLLHEAGLGQLAVDVQVEHRADRSGGCDLNGGPYFVAVLLVIDFASVPQLHHLAVALAGGRAEDDDHILQRPRYGVLQNLFE